MIKYRYIILLLLFISCHTTKITNSWKNDSYKNYQPKKVLVLGITPNKEARDFYEKNLTFELNKRNIRAYEGFNILEPDFLNLNQAEQEIENEVEELIELGFDTVLLATVKGFEERIPFDGNIFKNNDSFYGFENYYFLNQDIYNDRDYFKKYKVFHLEVSLYNISNKNQKKLVWLATYDIVDPKKIKNTIKKCISKILKSLEKEGIIPLIN
ncbi:hypothetical protein BX611_1160 [Lutibacter oceani]|uniref:Lipoprotein n=1 Tax=Lutibacter oceani TaxID=1853311 RepID=A0A3D9RY90_9FLAO|nr:hypothetical protein [Lutibacter oceani]REE81625.1 hypothetical protein BX611_1160 [Lutibacter oceani]